MADEIVEIKPSFGPVKLNLRALWRRVVVSSNPVHVVAQRFLSLFEDHGVAISQIPRFVPEVTLADLADTTALLAKLTPRVLDETADLFRVERAWLEGTSKQLYRTHFCYKQPKEFFRVLKSIIYEPHSFPVRVLTTSASLDRHNKMSQPMVLLITEKLAPAEGVGKIWDIDRYHIFGDGWDWSQWPCRIQLKAMARIIDGTLGERVPIFCVSSSELNSVTEGRLVPRRFVTRCLLTDPSLEDYSCTRAESAVAKETDELPSVLEYISAHQLDAICTSGKHAAKAVD